MNINVVGFPYGCDQEAECLDLIRLWRENEWDVTIVPLAPLHQGTLTKLTDLGCEFAFHLIEHVPRRILEARSLRHGIVVGLYHQGFFLVADRLRQMGCSLVWLGEPAVSGQELTFYKNWGLCDYYVVKSFFHRALLLKELIDFRCDGDRIFRIKPAMFPAEIDFNIVPHIPNALMCVGKVGCGRDRRFYPANSWSMLLRASTPLKAFVTEWSVDLEALLTRPKWVETIPEYDCESFYAKIHCLVQVTNRQESWLRFALDAMARGAPVIAQNDSSWKELIRHGENGFLCNSPEELSDNIDFLAQNENARIEMAIRARELLFGEVIDNRLSSAGWRQIFEKLV